MGDLRELERDLGELFEEAERKVREKHDEVRLLGAIVRVGRGLMGFIGPTPTRTRRDLELLCHAASNVASELGLLLTITVQEARNGQSDA